MISIVITIIIVIWILILFIKSMGSKSIKNYKNEIVSLGVLGTFIGIALGLFHFDATNVKDSLPFLLNGLKTAFITSGVGIFFSIIISINKSKKISNVTLETIGLNQLKIIETLEKSLDAISKSANEEIIKSLEKVVKDFNSHLTEQFGENFKELNSAVKEMITWQNNYKAHIQSYEKSLKQVLINLEKISVIKNNQEKNIENVIEKLSITSDNITRNLKETTDIVEENLQLLLREANGKL